MRDSDRQTMAPTGTSTDILRLENVHKCYPGPRQGLLGRRGPPLTAVAGIDLALRRGEALGLVGESGCGKSTLARIAALLLRPDSGRIRFEGREIGHLSRHALKPLHRRIQLVFQDPIAALNPRLSVGASVAEPLIVQGIGSRSQRRARVSELLTAVGLDPDAARRRPGAFSGGQRQRIAIARALALQPAVLIADEPVAALDGSVQSQILNLLRELQQRLQLSSLVISHDLAVIDHLADRIAVMYLGRIVESAPREQLFASPAHPYTCALLAALPPLQRRGGPIPPALDSGPTDLRRPRDGCPYRLRCPRARALCAARVPPLAPMPGRPAEHLAACFYPETPCSA
ncbi:MAG: ATP-binding cassette domain-containing protein [Candidatus Competibacterales bacterium]|nr:ATP-binding cassette domain-containing protein [Candidatus Competibacterales bacterium]